MSHCYGYNSYSELLDAARKEREEKARQLEIADLKYRIRERENECFELQKRVQELKSQLEILARNLAETPWCLACQVNICPNVGKNIDPMLVDRNECKNVLIRWVEQTIKE